MPKNTSIDARIASKIQLYCDAGFGLHWLHPKSKRPIGKEWSEARIASIDDLQKTYQQGNNLGVRLGLPSQLIDGSYLHVLDIDIRVSDLADEAWSEVERLFEGLDVRSFPTVVSGSGGASRHIYFNTSKPFFSRKLAVSEGKFRDASGKWHYEWEIELFGTGKQVAMPPSIHPDTSKPYFWERDFDFDLLSMGLGPSIAADRLEKIATAQSETYEFETREPLTYKQGQLEAELDELAIERIDDYHDWVTLGQALHHQFGGSQAGYALWVKHSKRSEKFDDKAQRELPFKWRGFGRSRRQPVTMATVRQWILDARMERMLAEFDDVDDFDDDGLLESQETSPPSNNVFSDDLDDLLGSSSPAVDPIDEIDALVSVPASTDVDPSVELDWKSLLAFNEKGAIKNDLHNAALIISHDPRIADIPQLNEFTNEVVQRKQPGRKSQRRNAAKPTIQLTGEMWNVSDTRNGDLWSDDRDFAIRRIIEAPKSQGGYDLKISDRDLKAAITLAADRNRFHPIKEYLNSLIWDGQTRAETLFIDYMGTEDNSYTRDIARLMLIAAVCRVHEPGHKFDYTIIIEGIQGKRKSTFIQVLGKYWFGELEGNFHDPKSLIELMQGKWIIELPELSGFNRSDVRSIKAFISRQTDRARLAYARRAGDFSRQCVFLGSTNDRNYLKDDTGGRRFWPIECSVDEIDIAKLQRNIDQIWAEAVHMYREMRVTQPHGTLPLYLTGSSADYALAIQETRRVESTEDVLLGQIEAWLDKPINDGGLEFQSDNEPPKMRDKFCSLQVWCECLEYQKRDFIRQVSQNFGRTLSNLRGWKPSEKRHNFGHPYGKQRYYERVKLPSHPSGNDANT